MTYFLYRSKALLQKVVQTFTREDEIYQGQDGVTVMLYKDRTRPSCHRLKLQLHIPQLV